MNADETAIYDAGNRTISFLEETANKTAIDAHDEIKNELVTVMQEVKSIADALLKQGKDTSQYSPAKKRQLDATVKTFVLLCHGVSVIANQAGNIDLEKNLNKPKTYYSSPENGGERETVTRLNAMLKLLNNNATLLKITAADLDKLTAAVDAFVNFKDVPKREKATKKVEGTDKIKVHSDLLHESLLRLHKVMNRHFDGQDILSSFNAIVEEVVLGNRYTNLYVTLKNKETGEIIFKGIIVLDYNLKIVHKALKRTGLIKAKKVKPGEQSGVAKAKGFKDAPFTVDLNRGKITELTVEMEGE